MKDIYQWKELINKQSNVTNEFKNFDKGTKTLDKKYFLINLGLLSSAREKKSLIPLKVDYFQ